MGWGPPPVASELANRALPGRGCLIWHRVYFAGVWRMFATNRADLHAMSDVVINLDFRGHGLFSVGFSYFDPWFDVIRLGVRKLSGAMRALVVDMGRFVVQAAQFVVRTANRCAMLLISEP